MRKVKRLLGSWNRTDFVFVAIGWAAIGIYTATPLLRSQPVTIREIGVGVGFGVYMLLAFRLAKLARRTLPTPRVKYTVSMSLIEILNEFTYTGYKVEAMTEDTVVLVRFSLKHLIAFPLLIIALLIGVALLLDSPEAISAAAIPVSLVSLFFAYFYTIAGYGYDRITFHQRSDSDTSTCLTVVNAFLPSRVRAAVISTDDHGDEAWYRGG